ncbi:type I-E CRISPR-associated protein Cse1/CasA [Mangrovihabitans endophyticus]|uniref:CRISPR-associated protein, Cse1 family n=1 Tax=Mangrovihabitans endophyticus TaxID=1751298 RepID=A0A8J3C914_9ACTN|nr:type I-E CRISPR-associated protein Cse1/CasA [Mangrovihabitans endophyticus]GGL20504.1 hypothetical protein GCM10012284_63900 [Mangrovihabitans endophyticus]
MNSAPLSFPLTTADWIPVLGRDGRPHHGGIRQVLDDADRFTTLAGDLPTQSFAILRILLAVLHRVTGPDNDRTWRALWNSPRLPVRDIEDYLDAFADRFDLLHPVTPFFQVADLRTDKDEPVGLTRLIADVPNGTPYLTARLGHALDSITAAEAARWLIHCQAYDPSGIKSGAVGDPRVKGGRGYPIGVGWCGNLGGTFLEGDTLRETLLLNLVPEHVPVLDRHPGDLPAWERAPHGPAEESTRTRGPHGPLSLYTWQSRRIRLFGDAEKITGALIANGDKLDPVNQQRCEPMSAWRHGNAKKNEKVPYRPARHDPARALWRGLAALLPGKPVPATKDGPAVVAPAVTEWLARLRRSGHVPADHRVTLHAVGIAYGTQQSVVDEVIDDMVTMPVQAFGSDSDLRTLIIDGAADAEATVAALRDLAANLARAAGARGDAPAEIAATAAESAFAAFDHEFRQWLSGLHADTDSAAARAEWHQRARRLALHLGGDLISRAGPAAWTGREVGGDKPRLICTPLADLWFRRKLHTALPMTSPQNDHTPTQEVVP